MVTAVKAPSGRTIWKAVRDELMLNLYPLPFSTIAPAVYHVYLHPDDFTAIEGVSARVVSQIEQALTAEVEKVNRGLQRSTRRVFTRLMDREDMPPIEMPGSGWEVHLCADRNGEIERGQLGIVSTLAMPAPAEYAGTPTTRIVKSVVGGGRRTSSSSEVAAAAPPSAPEVATPSAPVAAPPVPPRNTPHSAQPTAAASVGQMAATDSRERARLTYEDEQGPHVFLMRKDTVSIGRGGAAAWVDVQIVGSSKISREHLRLRADANGRFFIQDVSLWGTSVDGVSIPPAVKSAEGVAQPGPEQPLPAKARIGLSDAVVIDFDGTIAQ
jgi:pSer/pThr/pTyr-binding forkhead associated (FHA) protein